MHAGVEIGGSRIVAMPALTLKKLFIGNLRKDVPAGVIHGALSAIAPVRIWTHHWIWCNITRVHVDGNRFAFAQGLNAVELFEDETGGSVQIYMPGMISPSLTTGQFRHRGFCFAEYQDHASAYAALITMIDPVAAGGEGADGNGTDMVPPDMSRMAGRPNPVQQLMALGNQGTDIKIDWAEPLNEVCVQRTTSMH
jgi:RNA recognition motif-containing protein